MFAQHQVREETDHTSLLDMLNIRVGERRQWNRVGSSVDYMVDSRPSILQKLDNVRFERVFVIEVAWISRDLCRS